MKASLCVVTAFVSLVAMVFGPVGCNGQDIDCLFRHPAYDQCTGSFFNASSSPENRAAFCNGGCGQSLAQASVDCGDNFTVESIFSLCMANAQGSFCQDFFADPESDFVSNITTICFSDPDCTGACNDSLQELGCCAELGGFDIIFPDCNVSACEPPFILGPPNPPPPATQGTDLPFDGPLFNCLTGKVLTLPESCRELIFSDPSATNMNDFDFGQICASSCAESIAEAYYDCEKRYGSFYSVISNEQVNITFAQLLQQGCAKDNLDSSRVCFELDSDTSYQQRIQQATGDNSPCIESFTRGECLDGCRDVIESLGCCIRYFALFFTGPETQVLDYCNIQSCPVPFELDSTVVDPTTVTTDKADTIHSAPIVVVMVTIIAAVVNAIM